MIGREQVVLLQSRSKQGILEELVAVAARNETVEDADALFKAVAERESQHTTAIGFGFAVPHARASAVRDPVVVFGRSKQPIEFGALDGRPVSIFVLIAVAPNQYKEYVRNLARAARFLKKDENRSAILDASDENELAEILKAM